MRDGPTRYRIIRACGSMEAWRGLKESKRRDGTIGEMISEVRNEIKMISRSAADAKAQVELRFGWRSFSFRYILRIVILTCLTLSHFTLEPSFYFFQPFIISHMWNRISISFVLVLKIHKYCILKVCFYTSYIYKINNINYYICKFSIKEIFVFICYFLFLRWQIVIVISSKLL